MRALTLIQPWLGLIAAGLKPDENRPRQMIRRQDFGKPFALHAGREISKEALRSIIEVAPELCTDPSAPDQSLWWRLASITSAIVAVAQVDRCCVIHDGWLYDVHSKERAIAAAERRWAFGPVIYMLSGVRVLTRPVLCRGWQGFWRLTPETEARVLAELP